MSDEETSTRYFVPKGIRFIEKCSKSYGKIAEEYCRKHLTFSRSESRLLRFLSEWKKH